MNFSRVSRAAPQLLCFLCFAGCGDDQAARLADHQRQSQQQAIRRVLDLDAAFARPRDQVLNDRANINRFGQAIVLYAASMNGIDFAGVPEDVREAYLKHIEAWRAAGELMDHYSGFTGTLRAMTEGEAQARARIEAAQVAVNQSWETVKQAARAHGVEPGR